MTTLLRPDSEFSCGMLRTASACRVRRISGVVRTVPLEEVAKAAGGKSDHDLQPFAGRDDHRDAVIEEVVATELFAGIDHARTIDDVCVRIVWLRSYDDRVGWRGHREGAGDAPCAASRRACTRRCASAE